MVVSSVYQELEAHSRTWLVTGAAGFIGSHLVETLLQLGQKVIGLDNFSTGKRENLSLVEKIVGEKNWKNFRLKQGDIRERHLCLDLCKGVDTVLHQAALGSVPRSINDPGTTHEVNVSGFLNILLAARDCKVRRVVYASSSSVYGDSDELPKREAKIGTALSPYAASKQFNEGYSHVFARNFNMQLMGLRYFNVFGPRQDPDGPYAAVIPKWISALLNRQPCTIYGDGETSRDFCFISNVVSANLLAACAPRTDWVSEVYNIACGERTTLNELYTNLREIVLGSGDNKKPNYEPFRAGDVRHSLADISHAKKNLGYQVDTPIKEGLHRTVKWFSGSLGA